MNYARQRRVRYQGPRSSAIAIPSKLQRVYELVNNAYGNVRFLRKVSGIDSLVQTSKTVLKQLDDFVTSTTFEYLSQIRVYGAKRKGGNRKN